MKSLLFLLWAGCKMYIVFVPERERERVQSCFIVEDIFY